MVRYRCLLLAVFLLGSCTSAALPGGSTPLNALDKANKAQVDVALHDAVRGEEAYRAEFDTYTPDISVLMTQMGIRPPEGVTLTIASADAASFCIEARHKSLETIFHASNVSAIADEGPC